MPDPSAFGDSRPFMMHFDKRFAGVGRLHGEEGLARLRRASVCVIGLGGVGSWAAEALARCGVGRVRLVDLDEICVSNVNRQIHAVEGAIGLGKVRAMEQRLRSINPDIIVEALEMFYSPTTEERILDRAFEAVIDAIDSVPNKCRIAAACLRLGLPLIVSGGAGGRMDPTRVRIAPLEDASHDRLLSGMRRRIKHDEPRERVPRFLEIPCVHSLETPRLPGTRACGSDPGMNCESGYGSAVQVTGAFGFAAASWVVRHIASMP